jgi:hypothetical protein
LNIFFKETWYPLLQKHHIHLPKEGNDWVYFEQNTSLRGLQTGLFILWPESDDAAWLVVAVSPPKLHHLRETVPFICVDSAVQSTLHTGNWCAINLVTPYTEYVPTVFTVWICSVWLFGLYFFIRTIGSQVMTSLLQCNSHLKCFCKVAFSIKLREIGISW